MTRNWMIGLGVSVLVAASLLAVGIGAFNAGQRDAETVQVVTAGETVGDMAGRTMVVPVESWRGGWHGGPGFGFVLFPLIVIGLVLLFASRRRGGWCGPGPRSADDDLREWHRRAHADDPLATPGPTDGP